MIGKRLWVSLVASILGFLGVAIIGALATSASYPTNGVLAPPSNVDVIPTEFATDWPHLLQNESQVWSEGNTVVVHYNDTLSATLGTPIVGVNCWDGLSYSTDGGANFTRLRPNPLCSGHGVSNGDPSVVYNRKLGTWYAASLASQGDCGGISSGTGVGLWKSSNGYTWTTAPCAVTDNNADHPLMWVDNNCDSNHYGRMYMVWRDGDIQDAILVSYTDNPNIANAWTTVQTGPFSFVENIVTSPSFDGPIFIAGAERDQSSKPNIVTNYLYRSTDAGVTWSSGTQVGDPYDAPGEAGACNAIGILPNWPFDVAAQMAVGPDGVVHYVYMAPASGDVGNIYYRRSTDNGEHWSVATKLNTDSTTADQWFPSIAVTSQGAVFVSWYDRRDSPPSPTPGAYDYKYYGAVSRDNGASWQPNYQISDQPIENTANISDFGGRYCKQGEYFTHFGGDSTGYFIWDDGRNEIANPQGTPYPQADVYFAKATAIPTATVCTTQFKDVNVLDTYYCYIRALGCSNIIEGYACGGVGEPCFCDSYPYFRPGSATTRSQAAKIVSQAAAFNDSIPSNRQTFEDVPQTYSNWLYIERMYAHQAVDGYPCGGTNPQTGQSEPCNPPNNRPYYRPGNNASRGQTAKMISIAAGFSDVIPPNQQTFADIAPGSTFYTYVERLHIHNAVDGYPCGGPGELCIPPLNRPYFRPSSDATRGQTAKVVTISFFPHNSYCPQASQTGPGALPSDGGGKSNPATTTTPGTPGTTPTAPLPTDTISVPSPIPTSNVPTPVPTGWVPISPVPTGPVPTLPAR